MSVFDSKKILTQKRERRTLSEMLMSASGHNLSNTPQIRKERMGTGTIFVLSLLSLVAFACPGIAFGKSTSSLTLTSSLNPATYGNSVTFTATVTPPAATGTVTFKNGNTTLGTATISNGQATFSSSKLALGSQSITASYGGNTNYSSSTSTVLTETVNQANTTITLASSANPSTYRSSVKFTATVTPTAATGTVTFADGGTTLGTGTISGGKTTFSIATLAAGSHSITAGYGGGTDYRGSASSTLTQTVNKANTTVTLASSANPSGYGSSVTFTAKVTPSAATGTVTFTDGSTTLGAGTINNGEATYNTSTLAVGSHSITAAYSGDPNDNSSTSSTLTQTVKKATTATALSSSSNPSTYGNSVMFTVTVTPANATGTVTFKNGSTTLGTATLSGGTATYSTSALTVGSHSITAAYGGGTNDNSSTSSTLSQTVNKANTTVTLISSVNPSGYGSSVTFTATVTPTTATGTVTFADGSTTLGTATISSGSARYSTSILAVGSHSITASYGGDTNDSNSISTTLMQTVNKTNTTVTVASSANPSGYGSSVKFTATVTPATATGTVTFADGTSTLGTATISNGSAAYSTSTLAGGTHSITASYSGDTNDNSSTSSTLAQTVNKANTTVTLISSLNPSGFGSPVTFTAAVTPTTATGTVTFTDGSTTLGTATISNGSAAYSTSTLAGGTHSITASYSGDTNDNNSTSSTLTQTVNKANTTVTLASSVNPSGYGSSVMFTAAVTPTTATGTVTFIDGSTMLGTATLNNGSATYSASTLAVGSQSITASYSGDTNDASSTSTALTQTIASVPQVVATPLPAGTAGSPYSATLAATSGTTPYNWSISSSTLPAGLSLNASTGAITGAPSVAGTSNFTVQVTDANNLTATQPLSIVVAAVITALSPAFAPVGTNVTISGLGFGITPGTVAFNAVAATITSWGATSIVAAVPTGAGTGNVAITAGGVPSNGVNFTTTTGATQANLNTSRYQHSATILNNGQILVVGGVSCPTSGSCTYLNSAELYNPASSAFTNTGTMATPRSAPAVLLSSGKVVVAGGYTCDGSGNCSSLISAEIYDPNAGTFSSAGTMTVARSGHTMTLLSNGTVLIAGGENCTSATSCTALSSAEIYDPTAGTFTSTSNGMNGARFGASAVLLNTGSVLIAGGFDGNNLPASAEIYSPANGGFAGTDPSLNTPRFDASATLLNNGTVLVTGGSTCSPPGCPTNAAEIYDPVANTFNVVSGGMIVPRFNHSATLLSNGQVVVAGGYSSCSSSCSAEASTELFDPVAGSFTSGHPVANALAGHTGTLTPDGNALLIGGINAGVTLASDELYQPTSWTPPGLASITVAPGNSSLMPGQSETLVATGTFNDSSTQALQSIIWSSSNPSVATIGNSPGSAGIVNAMAAGTITLTATDGAVSGSSSLNVYIQAVTTVALTSSANPSTYGSPVMLTATVTPATATGTVTFMDGNTTLGTGTLSGGTATYSTSVLAVGSQSITASYGGDTNDTSSTSTTLMQTVNQTNTMVALMSSANPSVYGSQVTFTATVTPSTATGAVTFIDGSTTLGTGTLVGGIATYSASALAVGSQSITASYGGDTNDSNSTSSVFTETINAVLQVATTSLSAGMIDASYSAALAATGGTGPYTWSISSGSLPEGLSLDSGSGAITGAPMLESTSNFTVDVTDANNLNAAQALSIVITPSLTYSARTDNCVNGTQSGCVSGKTTGEAGATLIYQERLGDPYPTGFAPTTISSGSCPSGWTPSTYPAYCPAPMNSTATDPDFGAYLVMATDEDTNKGDAIRPYTAAWIMGSDGDWDAFSWDETMLLAKNSGDGEVILNINPAAIHAQTCATAPGCVNMSGIHDAANGGGTSTTLAHGGSWTWSRVASEPHVLYEMANIPTQVNQVTVTSSITTPGTGTLTRVVYADFVNGTNGYGGVMNTAAPGNTTSYTASWTGSFQVADDGSVSYALTGGYDWQGSWIVTVPDTFILPTVGNSGKYGFQATTAGTTGTAEPSWCTTLNCTVTDGGVVWTNIGTLAGQGPGFDLLVYRPPSTSAPGYTRINARLGKIYRGTGNTAPAGFITTNDQVVCTREGTYPQTCSLPDRFTLHEVGQAINGRYVEISPTGGGGSNAAGSWNSGTLSCQTSNGVWSGAWSPTTTYYYLNVVTYNGYYWNATKANGISGTLNSGTKNQPPPSSGWPTGNTYWSGTEAYCNEYVFDTTSTLVAPDTDWLHGSGHGASGYVNKYWDAFYHSMMYSLPVIDGVLNTNTPMLKTALPCDDHGTYRNAGTNDLAPMFTVTTDVPAWPSGYDIPNGACYEEICAFNSGGSGLTYRFGHTYNTGSSPYFAIQNNIGVISPFGDLLAFGTDMMGVRGSSAAPNAACNNLRGQYQPSASGTVTYQDSVYPLTNNNDHNIFQATSCGADTAGATCTEGATLPDWDTACGTLNSICTDGGVTWTNLGPNTCRGDIVILDTLSSHPAP